MARAGTATVGAEWQEYWRLWAQEMPASARFLIPKPVKEMPFWRKQMAKALKTELQKRGYGCDEAGIRDQGSGVRG